MFLRKASARFAQKFATGTSMTRAAVIAANSGLCQPTSMGFFGSVKFNRSVVSTQTRQFSSLPDHIVLEMPNLSPTMEKGNIKKWGKKVGEKVGPGDVLASIETDKAVVDFEMQEEGFVAKLLYPEGAKDVPLGVPVAILVDSEADVAAFANYTGGASESAPAAKPAEAAQPAASAKPAGSAKKYPDHIKLEMPNLSPTMEKGNIKRWAKKVGDKVGPGDVLADIETDKAVVAFEMQEEGYVAALLYPEGTADVKLGELVAILVDD